MERSFHILLYRAFHIQRKWVRARMQLLGVGAGQPKLLVYLSAHGPCHQRQLADYFDVDPANVSRMIESLEKGGFVIRKPDGQNRRRKRSRCGLEKRRRRISITASPSRVR